MTKESRKYISVELTTEVLIRSGRKCCLCEYLDGNPGPHKGQIAHINKHRSDSRFENLVYLCLNHHDQYDSVTSQSKGFTSNEVKYYRDKLYNVISDKQKKIDESILNHSEDKKSNNRLNKITTAEDGKYNFLIEPWSSILIPEETLYLFPFKSPNGADGVCYVERIHLKTGQIAIICSDAPENPGISAMNAIEYVLTQICAHYELNPNNIICLEHYRDSVKREDRWLQVKFDLVTSEGLFQNPDWEDMNENIWKSLGLRPCKSLAEIKELGSMVKRI